jgi:hypothetical protein
VIRPLVAGLLALAIACSHDGRDAARRGAGAGLADGYVECVVPRPELCTREYRPVCALRDLGIRCVTRPCDSWETKTFPNACTACADDAVQGWRPGECEQDEVVHPE